MITQLEIESCQLIAEGEPWKMGDSPVIATELAELIVAGIKTATCSAYACYEEEPLPKLGMYHQVLSGEGLPVCKIRIISLQLVQFNQVTDEMAFKEGEGDRTLAYWRQVHQDFFTRNGGFSADMWLVYAEFIVVDVY